MVQIANEYYKKQNYKKAMDLSKKVLEEEELISFDLRCAALLLFARVSLVQFKSIESMGYLQCVYDRIKEGKKVKLSPMSIVLWSKGFFQLLFIGLLLFSFSQ
jgi:hypothetical protein